MALNGISTLATKELKQNAKLAAATTYVNGQQIGTPDTGVTFYQFINSGIEAVARSDNYWRGDIGAVAIYGQALNATQIQQNFNALRGRYGL